MMFLSVLYDNDQGRSFEEDKQNALRRLAYEKEEEWKRTLDNALAQQEASLKVGHG